MNDLSVEVKSMIIFIENVTLKVEVCIFDNFREKTSISSIPLELTVFLVWAISSLWEILG